MQTHDQITLLLASPAGRGRRAAPGEGRSQSVVRISHQAVSLTPSPSPKGRGE